MRLVNTVEVSENRDPSGWVVSIGTELHGAVYYLERQRGGCRVFKDLETLVATLRRAGVATVTLRLS